VTGRRRPGARAISVGALSALLALALAPAPPAAAAAPAASQATAGVAISEGFQAGQIVTRVHLRYRGSSTVGLIAARTLRVSINPGDQKKLVLTTAGVPHDLYGPLPRGAHVGRAVILRGGRELASVPLITARAVSKATLGQRLRDFLSRPLTIVALGLLLGCSLLLATLRARATRREPASHDGVQGTEAAG
jgi:hypothetical protein